MTFTLALYIYIAIGLALFVFGLVTHWNAPWKIKHIVKAFTVLVFLWPIILVPDSIWYIRQRFTRR